MTVIAHDRCMYWLIDQLINRLIDWLIDWLIDLFIDWQAKVAEFENNTIVKQRHELNLLIEELQDRDKELNKMVDSHKQQLLNWEKDRRTILTQDEKISRLEGTVFVFF